MLLRHGVKPVSKQGCLVGMAVLPQNGATSGERGDDEMNKGRGAARWIAMAVWLAGCGGAAAQTLPVPPGLVSLADEAGGRLLVESTAREAYWPLSVQFVTQKNQAFCGVASMVMVLNALAIPAPDAPGLEPYRTFTQDNVLDGATEQIVPESVVLQQGMTLDQFGAVIRSHGVSADVFHADQLSVDDFRRMAAHALGTRGLYVVVNFLRKPLGEESGGHFSPLAAFDAKTDRFLVLDVARYKYPPVWVKTADLYAAMNTVDSVNDGRERGFVLIRKTP